MLWVETRWAGPDDEYRLRFGVYGEWGRDALELARMTPPDVISRHSDPLARFFAYAVEREAVRIRRARGDAGPWTGDAQLRAFSFCNVFREDDRVTRWYAANVRERYRDTNLILLATVVFRWFNRVTTGQALFSQEGIEGTPFEVFARTGSAEILVNAIRFLCPNGPWVTGSYMVPTPQGLGRNKMEGVADLCAAFWARAADYPGDVATSNQRWPEVTEMLRADATWPADARVGTLVRTWAWLRQHPFQGDFNAYEVVTDLRHSLLAGAPDIMTWANAGPGAIRGLNRVYGRPLTFVPKKTVTCDEMRLVLVEAQSLRYWPATIEGEKTRLWEMREVEHTLCEFDKHERLTRGEGSMKRRFVPCAI